jgi:hypothetical protein
MTDIEKSLSKSIDELKFEYDQLTEEFICELDDKTVMIISGGNRGTWAQYFNAQKPTDTVTLSKAEYDALVADAGKWRSHENDVRIELMKALELTKQ